jgi:alcohol dehydrogenase class IV
MLSVIPSISSKVLILTGRSIATKTPLVQQLESLLGTHHTATFSEIEQHGQVHGVNQAFEIVLNDSSIDTIVSIGGGSPIDSAKTISHRIHEERGTTLTHIAIPTTLSAAECTAAGGYTNEEGVKIGFHLSVMGIQTVFYDPTFAKYTPTKLWIGTGMRAVDHAVECFYHTNASEMPWKVLSFWALSILFECLPKSLSNPDDEEVTTKLRLAAFASAGFRGKNVKGGMGLSYSLGHALGSPYGIPRGSSHPFLQSNDDTFYTL